MICVQMLSKVLASSCTLVSHSFAILVANVIISSVHHLVQTAHDNSLVLSYGGQGRDPHLPSTK